MNTLQNTAALAGVAMLLSLHGAAFADRPKPVKRAVKQIRKDHKEYHKDVKHYYKKAYKPHYNRYYHHDDHDRDYKNESWGISLNPNGGLGLYYSENKASYPGYGYGYGYPSYSYTGYGYGGSYYGYY